MKNRNDELSRLIDYVMKVKKENSISLAFEDKYGTLDIVYLGKSFYGADDCYAINIDTSAKDYEDRRVGLMQMHEGEIQYGDGGIKEFIDFLQVKYDRQGRGIGSKLIECSELNMDPSVKIITGVCVPHNSNENVTDEEYEKMVRAFYIKNGFSFMTMREYKGGNIRLANDRRGIMDKDSILYKEFVKRTPESIGYVLTSSGIYVPREIEGKYLEFE